MAKDYYIILGIGPDASLEQVKTAYRRKAKRCHPDHSGEGSEPFLALQEAYEVLGDPDRRQAYDDEIAQEARVQRSSRGVRPEPLRRRRCPVEPLVPTRRRTSPQDAFWESSFPSLIAELLHRPWTDMDAPIRPRARRGVEEIQVEVPLTHEQALQGGCVRVRIPVQLRCPTCHGWGGEGFFECLQCFGTGMVAGEHQVEVAFPAGVVDRSIGRVSLSLPGPREASLALHFRVHEW